MIRWILTRVLYRLALVARFFRIHYCYQKLMALSGEIDTYHTLWKTLTATQTLASGFQAAVAYYCDEFPSVIPPWRRDDRQYLSQWGPLDDWIDRAVYEPAIRSEYDAEVERLKP